MGENNFFEIREFKSLPSTNLYLKENYDEFRDFTVVIADAQTNGYGRKGREWNSSKGGLWFSFIVSTDDPFFWISCASVSIVDLFPELKIKWPNDIYFQNFKVAGILSEKIKDKIIVGVGLNVNNNINDELKDKAISLTNIYKKKFSTKNLLNRILSKIYDNSQNYENIFEKWRNYSIILGKKLTIKVSDKIYQGKVVDLLNTGELVLSDSNHKRKILYGDIIRWEEI